MGFKLQYRTVIDFFIKKFCHFKRTKDEIMDKAYSLPHRTISTLMWFIQVA